MVDPLSISSLALQLVRTTREIYGIWKSISGASAEYVVIADCLDLISKILQELGPAKEDHQISERVVCLALERCQTQLQEFWLVIDDL